MVKSLNTKMDMSCKGTWYRNGPFYGNIMVGDNAFELQRNKVTRLYPNSMG